MQEKHLDNIRKYHNLKRKPVSVAQARKNMIVYLMNMARYKIAHFKGMTYDQVRPIFEREFNKLQTFLQPDRDEEPTKKRGVEETMLQEIFKKLRAEVEVSGSHFTQDTPTDDPKEMFEEDVKTCCKLSQWLNSRLNPYKSMVLDLSKVANPLYSLRDKDLFKSKDPHSLTVNTVRLSDDFFGADNDMRNLDGVELDISNIFTTYPVPTTLNTRIYKDHCLDNVIGDRQSGEEPKRISNALKDPTWVEAMQEELLQFHLQKFWTLVDFPRGKKDQTLVIKRQKEDILLVQVYVDDIIFGSTKKEWRIEFEDKYVDETLRKLKYEDVKPASSPMDKEKALLKDSYGDDVDVYLYRSMIGSLMYLTSSRPDIMFVVCTYAIFQVNPKASHLYVVKRIFRYIKRHPKLGLWYPRDYSFDLVAYTDSDYAEASLDRKST
uniref:Reverse transcriptase Ty1/copia-type domain-containing protein n=1 Tax=Tanacetum cinerariifolium TaxID=118510 RepID=A0A6L2JPH9_TANCI|nr:hypothetical protein [Tanacetum cinerariifolium]